VDGDDETDRCDAEPLAGEVQRDCDPEQGVDEVLDVAGLCRGEQRPVAVGRALQDFVEGEVRVVVVVVAFGFRVLDGLLYEKMEMRKASTTTAARK